MSVWEGADGIPSALIQAAVYFLPDTGANEGDYRVRTIGSTANFNFTFAIPEDFKGFVSCELIGVLSAGAAGPNKDIDLSSSYGNPSQSSTEHQEVDSTTLHDYSGSAGDNIALDLSSVLNSLSAGDIVGINVDHNSIGGAVDYTILKLVYSR